MDFLDDIEVRNPGAVRSENVVDVVPPPPRSNNNNDDDDESDETNAQTRFVAAAFDGDLPRVRALEPLVAINGLEERHGVTALLAACQRETAEDVVLFLLDHPDIDVNCPDPHCGMTPLHLLVAAAPTTSSSTPTRALECILQNKTLHVNAPEPHCGMTPLHMAVTGGNWAALQCLARHPDVDWMARERILGLTPLHFAALLNQVAVARYLLERPDVDLNAVNILEQTPLHHACLHGSVETVELLLAQPAVDLVGRDQCGKTALDVSEAAPIVQRMHAAVAAHTGRSLEAILRVPEHQQPVELTRAALDVLSGWLEGYT